MATRNYMNNNIDVQDVVILAKKLCFEIEVILATKNYGVDLEEEWHQKGPRAMVRFLVEQVAHEDFEARKTSLIQNTERFKSWLAQCHYEYQKKWPNHINEVGGSVPARRVEMFKRCDDFIAMCKNDVHDIADLYELAMLTPEQAHPLVEQPLQSIVYDHNNSEHMVRVEANRKDKFEQRTSQQNATQHNSFGGG